MLLIGIVNGESKPHPDEDKRQTIKALLTLY